MPLLISELKNFNGTEQWYKHSLTGFLYTDGVKYVAEKGQAYWLIDKILILMKHSPVSSRLKSPDIFDFAVWKLKLNDDDSAIVTCGDGNENTVYSEKIEWTDFPMREITLYFEQGVLLLPSEH